MTEWHRTRRGDLGLRALGSGACALSYLSIRHLMALHDADPAHWSPDVLAYALTAIGFLGASGGSATTIMGKHIFDQVEISERWRRRPDGFSSSSIGPTGFQDPDLVNLSDPTAPGVWGRRDLSVRREDANLFLRRSSASSASMRLHEPGDGDVAVASAVVV